MGVDYRRYFIPRPNTLRSAPEAIATLVDALRQERWIVDPTSPNLKSMTFSGQAHRNAQNAGYFVRSFVGDAPGQADLAALLYAQIQADLLLRWPVESLLASGLDYPLEPPPHLESNPFTGEDGTAECYYDVEFHFGRDFVYHTSDVVDPFNPPPVCGCGTKLDYWPEGKDPFYDARIARTCAKCGVEFDPTDRRCRGVDGCTGETISIPGGATYRFAIVIDCGKMFGEGSPRFKPELKRLVERVLGSTTYEVADFY